MLGEWAVVEEMIGGFCLGLAEPTLLLGGVE